MVNWHSRPTMNHGTDRTTHNLELGKKGINDQLPTTKNKNEQVQGSKNTHNVTRDKRTNASNINITLA